MNDVLHAVLEAAATIDRDRPIPMELWVTRAMREHHSAARVDLPDRLLFFVSPEAMRTIEAAASGSALPLAGGPSTFAGAPYTFAGARVRNFDQMPRDARLTLACEVNGVSPTFAARLAVI